MTVFMTRLQSMLGQPGKLPGKFLSRNCSLYIERAQIFNLERYQRF
jgi:hypothetical protein